MPELFDTTYWRGQGPLLMADRDANGNPTGLEFVGDLEGVTLNPNITRWKIKENTSGGGAIGASGVNETEIGITIGFRSVKPSHLAKILQGALTTVAGASATAQPHVVNLGKMSRMSHVKISAVAVKGVGGTPTYVLDTDYKVHPDEGLIEWLSGGTVTEALAVEIDYTYAAQQHLAVNPENADKYLVFSGMNTANNNKQQRVELYKVQLDPGAMDLISDEPQPMNVNGVLLLDTLRADGDRWYGVKSED